MSNDENQETRIEEGELDDASGGYRPINPWPPRPFPPRPWPPRPWPPRPWPPRPPIWR